MTPSRLIHVQITADTRKYREQLILSELKLGAGPLRTLKLHWMLWRVHRELAR